MKSLLYQPGDIVIVRADLRKGHHGYFDANECDVYVNEYMAEFAGREVTIAGQTNSGRGYNIQEDQKAWYWTDTMFAPLSEVTYDLPSGLID